MQHDELSWPFARSEIRNRVLMFWAERRLQIGQFLLKQSDATPDRRRGFLAETDAPVESVISHGSDLFYPR